MRFLTVTGWEIKRYLTSRIFWIWTFIIPLLLGGLILIPLRYYQDNLNQHPRLIGYIEFELSRSYYDSISKRLANTISNDRIAPQLLLSRILPDTTEDFRRKFQQAKRLQHQKDSLSQRYNRLKKRRRYLFQLPDSPNKQQLLRKSYNRFIELREKRDLTRMKYKTTNAQIDSLAKHQILKKADSLLRTKSLDGYLLVDAAAFEKGTFQFHSLSAVNFLQLKPLEQALQSLLVEERMRKAGITGIKIQRLLHPVEIQSFQTKGNEKQEFNLETTYMPPILAILFLFIALSTAGSILFASIISEKSANMLETLLISVPSPKLIAAKIIAAAVLGLIQVLIWTALTFIVVSFGSLSPEALALFTLNNGCWFLLYFLLGYLSYAAVFITAGALVKNESEAHRLNYTLRFLSFIPLFLGILVLQAPDSLVSRLLSFIPFLAPTFMLLRTFLAEPPVIDYYISVLIMLAVIVPGLFLGGRIFFLTSLNHQPIGSFRKLFKTLYAK